MQPKPFATWLYGILFNLMLLLITAAAFCCRRYYASSGGFLLLLGGVRAPLNYIPYFFTGSKKLARYRGLLLFAPFMLSLTVHIYDLCRIRWGNLRYMSLGIMVSRDMLESIECLLVLLSCIFFYRWFRKRQWITAG